MRVLVFGGKRGVEHGRVIGGKYDGDAVANEFRQGVVLDCWRVATQLKSESSGAQVALGTNLERNAAVGQQVHQRKVMDGGDTVANAFRPEQLDGFADFLR